MEGFGMVKRVGWIVGVLAVLLLPQICFGSGLDNIKKTYAGVNSLEASFHQKIYISGLKKVRDFDGQFLYKRGKGFLWRYTKPRERMFLYDGKFMWQDEEEKTFVLKEKVNRDKTGGTFFDLVEDIAALDNLFTLKEESMAQDLGVLELSPRKEGSVKSAKIWIDKENFVRKIEIVEFTGNINTMEFTNTKVNGSISDGKFIFKGDKGKEIVER